MHKNIILGFIISFLHLLSESRRRSQFPISELDSKNKKKQYLRQVFSSFPEVLFCCHFPLVPFLFFSSFFVDFLLKKTNTKRKTKNSEDKNVTPFLKTTQNRRPIRRILLHFLDHVSSFRTNQNLFLKFVFFEQNDTSYLSGLLNDISD